MAGAPQVSSPVDAAMTKTNGVVKIEEIIHAEPPRLLILFDKGQDEIVRIVADVLGQAYCVVESLEGAGERADRVIVGLENGLVSPPEALQNSKRTVVTTHAIDLQDLRDEYFTSLCDYEYLYTQKNFAKRDAARFFGFILGQIRPHDDLKKKSRSTLLSTTFPDIRAALPNLDILTVGADSVELRVDLLEEPLDSGGVSSVPGVKYVGEQVMLLRQRTELPIIFTTRCTAENGRFPMDDPIMFYNYLYKAIQWGCEYIDVELWLPEEIRRRLAAAKGNSKIIAAWHDFSGHFKWTSAEAQQLFKDAAFYGDVVKMIALIKSSEENYALEYFRSTVQSAHPHPPFSGLNMGPIGQLSRTLNKVFTPVTHPLLPVVAAPGQLSVAEINSMLHSMGQMPKLDIYAVGKVCANGQAMFFEKCLNELSLPHQLLCLERIPKGTMEHLMNQVNFGGAFLNPSLPALAAYLPNLTDAADAIGQVDTVVARPSSKGKTLVGDNVTWKGIRAALTREFVPCAYANRPALVLASTEAQATPAIYALQSLGIGCIYTIGFQVNNFSAMHTMEIHHFRGIEDMKKVEEPFVIVSALSAQKSHLVAPLLKHYGKSAREKRSYWKVFLDLSNGIQGRGDSVDIATELGYSAYGVSVVNAFTMVEMLRLLVGFNVGFDFVTLASGRSLYA